MADDSTLKLPDFDSTDPIKDEMYRLRGEAVSVGGTVEWIVRRLDDEFVGSSQPSTERRWTEIKKYIRDRHLTATLQPELHAVAACFKARQFAAHAATILGQVGESTQIFRLYFDGPKQQIDVATMDDLRQEATTVRAGYEAIQRIGRALDKDRPEVLREWNAMPKFMLIGQL